MPSKSIACLHVVCVCQVKDIRTRSTTNMLFDGQSDAYIWYYFMAEKNNGLGLHGVIMAVSSLHEVEQYMETVTVWTAKWQIDKWEQNEWGVWLQPPYSSCLWVITTSLLPVCPLWWVTPGRSTSRVAQADTQAVWLIASLAFEIPHLTQFCWTNKRQRVIWLHP